MYSSRIGFGNIKNVAVGLDQKSKEFMEKQIIFKLKPYRKMSINEKVY